WDSLNRLLSITYADESQTEFAYDALSRRVKEVEKDAEGEVVSEKRLLWCGTQICEERDAENSVVKRYAGAGVALADDSKYYFTRDHLGSVRQVSDEDEAVVETYTYDAYGVQTASAAGGPGGVRLSDFRYTGHWYHEKSELHLALYRAYDAELGLWISEDPIQEAGGLNLYGYVGNSPLAKLDPSGLVTFDNFVNTATSQQLQEAAKNFTNQIGKADANLSNPNLRPHIRQAYLNSRALMEARLIAIAERQAAMEVATFGACAMRSFAYAGILGFVLTCPGDAKLPQPPTPEMFDDDIALPLDTAAPSESPLPPSPLGFPIKGPNGGWHPRGATGWIPER
ncbi:MAG: RHS repeat-associated core domain-containing protein, partial [Prosthecobacter sp.]|nr:RHS repeat-associated core domain-containing protein [Prosthecobacter sp.]